MRKEITSLKRHISLSEKEWNELDLNFDQYGQTIAELLQETSRSQTLTEETGHLDSELARLNYDIYEKHMATHTNAIKLSGIVAESKLTGKTISTDIRSQIDHILDNYLMLTL